MDTTFTLTVLILGLYRIVAIMAGVGIAWMGFRLFCFGVFDKAGELAFEVGRNKLLLKRAAPGTFFSVCGTAIVIVTLYRGMVIEIDLESGSLSSSSSTGSQSIQPDPMTSPNPAPSSDSGASSESSTESAAPGPINNADGGSSAVGRGVGGRLRAELAPTE
jgi:hypothetical protein